MRVPVAVALTSALLLTGGCGVAATQFHPGIAAEVGHGRVSTDDVDTATAAFCHYLTDSPGSALDAQPIPLSQLRSEVAAQLALLEASKQVAQEKHVTTGTIYAGAVADDAKDPGNASLSADDLKQVVLLNTSSAYIGDIILAVGAQLLTEQGTTIPSDPTKANALESPVGVKYLGDWIDDHVQLDPRYDVHLAGTVATQGDEGISFAQSSEARAALLPGSKANQLTPDQVKALPASQRCGG